jgi:hypothetical protein
VDTQAPFEWRWNRDFDDEELIDEGFVQVMARGYTADEEYYDSIGVFKVM